MYRTFAEAVTATEAGATCKPKASLRPTGASSVLSHSARRTGGDLLLRRELALVLDDGEACRGRVGVAIMTAIV